MLWYKCKVFSPSSFKVFVYAFMYRSSQALWCALKFLEATQVMALNLQDKKTKFESFFGSFSFAIYAAFRTEPLNKDCWQQIQRWATGDSLYSTKQLVKSQISNVNCVWLAGFRWLTDTNLCMLAGADWLL